MQDFSSLINEILQVSDIRDIVAQYVSLKKVGKNYQGLCPFHKDTKPSFNVSEEKALWHCFGCGQGGNIFHFLMKIENMNFIEAAKYLSQRYGIPWRIEYDKEKATKREILYTIHKVAAEYYRQNLYNNKEALNYLIKERELTKDVIDKFQLGYALPSYTHTQQFLKNKGFSLENIEEAGLIIKKEDGSYYDRFRDRIILPIFDVTGNVVAFSARVLKEEDEPKYLNSPDTPIFTKGKILYGLNFAKNAITQKDVAVLVEGHLDVITAHQHNIENTICSMGTALTEAQCYLLIRFTKNVIIAYDSDDAGIDATKRAIEILIDKGVNIKVANMPASATGEPTDPDKVLRKAGAQYFNSILNNAISSIEFYLKLILKEKEKLTSADEKTKAIEKISSLLEKINNPIIRDEYIKTAAARLGIEEEIIRSFKVFRKKTYEKEKKEIEKLPLLGQDRIEKELIELMLHDEVALNLVRQTLQYTDFKNEAHQNIVKLLFQYNDIQKVINELEDATSREIITEILLKKDIPTCNEQIIEDYINMIKRQRLRDKLKELQHQIKFYADKKDYEKSKELVKDYVEYETRLRNIGGE